MPSETSGVMIITQDVANPISDEHFQRLMLELEASTCVTTLIIDVDTMTPKQLELLFMALQKNNSVSSLKIRQKSGEIKWLPFDALANYLKHSLILRYFCYEVEETPSHQIYDRQLAVNLREIFENTNNEYLRFLRIALYKDNMHIDLKDKIRFFMWVMQRLEKNKILKGLDLFGFRFSHDEIVRLNESLQGNNTLTYFRFGSAKERDLSNRFDDEFSNVAYNTAAIELMRKRILYNRHLQAVKIIELLWLLFLLKTRSDNPWCMIPNELIFEIIKWVNDEPLILPQQVQAILDEKKPDEYPIDLALSSYQPVALKPPTPVSMYFAARIPQTPLRALKNIAKECFFATIFSIFNAGILSGLMLAAGGISIPVILGAFLLCAVFSFLFYLKMIGQPKLAEATQMDMHYSEISGLAV